MNKDLIDTIVALSKTDKKNLSQKTTKLGEEFGELCRAILPFEDAFATTHRFVDRMNILEEVCDVLITARSIAADLGFTEAEIEEMAKAKTVKWAELQARERNAKWPVPFEIHVTVRGAELDAFRAACALAEVKPIVIDLQNKEGTSVLEDVMTSSVHLGTNSSAHAEMMRISKAMRDAGLSVVREKIETVPWHPAAPSRGHAKPAMPKDCYFESHLAVRTTEDRLPALRKAAEDQDMHLSRNVFKRLPEGELVVMTTYRKYDGVQEDFEQEANFRAKGLEGLGFQVDKVIIEFSVFDTKVSHDASWLQKAAE